MSSSIFRAKGVRLFSPSDFRRIFGVSLRATQEFVKDHCDDLFLKIRNGLYALRIDQPRDEVIANRLYAPSYISFEYALSATVSFLNRLYNNISHNTDYPGVCCQ